MRASDGMHGKARACVHDSTSHTPVYQRDAQIEKMERLHGEGTLDHKLVGKLQQLQQLYPSIVKLHQRKQVSHAPSPHHRRAMFS